MHTANNGHFLFKKEHVKYLFDSVYYPQAHAFNFLIVLTPWIFLTLFSMYHLYCYSKIHEDNTGPQAKLWLIISIFGYTGGCSTFLPMFGINLYPTALPLLPSYALMQTYAIFKYQLFNLKIVIEKSIVYSLLIAVVSIAYLAIVLTSEKALQNLLGYKSMPISLSVAFIIGIIVIPLRNRIQFLLDRSLFKGTQPEIAAENELLRQEITQSEKYKTLSTLATGIAHEVKNPLTAMKTFCEYLPQKLNDKEFLLKFSRLVGHEVDRIDAMVHDLLDYGKPSPPALKETDINKLIQDTLNTLNSQFIKNHIEVTFESSVISRQSSDPADVTSGKHQNCTLNPKPCPLNIDPNRIKQALLNLLLNAIEAMPSGGQLAVETTIHDSLFAIHIQDTGHGIPPEDLKHVFDPFFSLKDNGTGLGLAIVQRIVEQHGGKVSITSQVGVGTVVKVELPCPILDT